MENKRSILIIEDDPLILDVLQILFSKKQWEVAIATDGETGLATVDSMRPDIVLLDILLPGMSGYDVLKKMKDSDSLRPIPVLVLSNYGQKEEIQKSIDLGAVDHLVKANIIVDDVAQHALDIIEHKYVRKSAE